MNTLELRKIIGKPKLVLIDRGPVEYRSTDGKDTRLKFSEVANKREKDFPKELQFSFPGTIADFFIKFGQDSDFFHWQLYNPAFPPARGSANRIISGYGSLNPKRVYSNYPDATERSPVLCVLYAIFRKLGYSAKELKTIKEHMRIAEELSK